MHRLCSKRLKADTVATGSDSTASTEFRTGLQPIGLGTLRQSGIVSLSDVYSHNTWCDAHANAFTTDPLYGWPCRRYWRYAIYVFRSAGAAPSSVICFLVADGSRRISIGPRRFRLNILPRVLRMSRSRCSVVSRVLMVMVKCWVNCGYDAHTWWFKFCLHRSTWSISRRHRRLARDKSHVLSSIDYGENILRDKKNK